MISSCIHASYCIKIKKHFVKCTCPCLWFIIFFVSFLFPNSLSYWKWGTAGSTSASHWSVFLSVNVQDSSIWFRKGGYFIRHDLCWIYRGRQRFMPGMRVNSCVLQSGLQCYTLFNRTRSLCVVLLLLTSLFISGRLWGPSSLSCYQRDMDSSRSSKFWTWLCSAKPTGCLFQSFKFRSPHPLHRSRSSVVGSCFKEWMSKASDFRPFFCIILLLETIDL